MIRVDAMHRRGERGSEKTFTREIEEVRRVVSERRRTKRGGEDEVK